RLFWIHHYPRCQAADRRHDEDHGDPDRKHFVQQHHGSPPPLAVGTKPLAYSLKFHFQRENAKPDRHSQRDGRKLKPNRSLHSRTLNTLTLCRVPDMRENLWRGEAELRFIGPSQVISNSLPVCCAQVPESVDKPTAE